MSAVDAADGSCRWSYSRWRGATRVTVRGSTMVVSGGMWETDSSLIHCFYNVIMKAEKKRGNQWKTWYRKNSKHQIISISITSFMSVYFFSFFSFYFFMVSELYAYFHGFFFYSMTKLISDMIQISVLFFLAMSLDTNVLYYRQNKDNKASISLCQ